MGTFISLSQLGLARMRSCLTCHGTATAAPANLLSDLWQCERFFGWKLNEVIGAQIVSVPTTVAENIASHLYRTLLLYIAATFLVALVVIDVALYYVVIVLGKAACGDGGSYQHVGI